MEFHFSQVNPGEKDNAKLKNGNLCCAFFCCVFLVFLPLSAAFYSVRSVLMEIASPFPSLDG